MPLLSRHDAAVFHLPGIRFTTLASPRRGARENAVWEVTLDPGVAGSPHRLTREEIFVALEGSAVVELDGRHHALAEGSALVVAAGQSFALSNPGSRPFRALAVLPVGGQAVIGGNAPFTPEWAQ